MSPAGGHKNFHNQHYLQPPVVVPLLVGIVHHNIIPFMLLSAVHTTCGCSGAVNHGHNAGLCTILTCSWCVANFGFESLGARPHRRRRCPSRWTSGASTWCSPRLMATTAAHPHTCMPPRPPPPQPLPIGVPSTSRHASRWTSATYLTRKIVKYSSTATAMSLEEAGATVVSKHRKKKRAKKMRARAKAAAKRARQADVGRLSPCTGESPCEGQPLPRLL
jgi:hypothetical protein